VVEAKYGNMWGGGGGVGVLKMLKVHMGSAYGNPFDKDGFVFCLSYPTQWVLRIL
jgi:hypothetical protein